MRRTPRKRYMICWTHGEITGRDHWLMERDGKLSSADIKKHEYMLAEKWKLKGAVTITNIVAIN